MLARWFQGFAVVGALPAVAGVVLFWYPGGIYGQPVGGGCLGGGLYMFFIGLHSYRHLHKRIDQLEGSLEPKPELAQDNESPNRLADSLCSKQDFGTTVSPSKRIKNLYKFAHWFLGFTVVGAVLTVVGVFLFWYPGGANQGSYAPGCLGVGLLIFFTGVQAYRHWHKIIDKLERSSEPELAQDSVSPPLDVD